MQIKIERRKKYNGRKKLYFVLHFVFGVEIRRVIRTADFGRIRRLTLPYIIPVDLFKKRMQLEVIEAILAQALVIVAYKLYRGSWRASQ